MTYYFGHYPSIELQALAFAEQVKERPQAVQSIDTEWNDFAVELGYIPVANVSSRSIGTTLIVCNISVPARYQCSKWLLQYCKFCTLLAKDALMVFSDEDWIEDVLSEHPDIFHLAKTGIWLHEKRNKAAWPTGAPR